MRKSPFESATLFNIGTKKEGIDNNYYYVLTDKNNRKRWVAESCLFVIYKINPESKTISWNYGKFPADWDFIGTGSTVRTNKLHGSTIKYPREEQFMGNPKYTDKMKDLLSKLFQKLKDRKIIIDYKIVTRKGLHNYMNKVK